MNDCNFVINRAPRPSNDDIVPAPTVKVIAKVGEAREDDANARLIAAAPDLLAACEEALAFLMQKVSTNVLGKPEDITVEELCGLSGGPFVARVLAEAVAKAKGG
jgi:hypothetical protein